MIEILVVLGITTLVLNTIERILVALSNVQVYELTPPEERVTVQVGVDGITIAAGIRDILSKGLVPNSWAVTKEKV